MSDSARELLDWIHRAQVSRLLREYAAPSTEGCRGGPYGWQLAFHEAGARNTERAIIAANRVGKTRTAAAEFAIHLTGLYPSWWTGRRWTRPVHAIVAGQTNEDLRDIQQLALVGPPGPRGPVGNGWLPRELFEVAGYRQCGVQNVIDSVRVKHTSGGTSMLQLKSYEQGWEKFQGRETDLIWLDEEIDDFKLFTECQTRLLTTRGMLVFTATPLKGLSHTVLHFRDGVSKSKKGIWFIGVGWDAAPHLSPEQREEWAARYPEHERRTRTEGIPLMGTGLVYPVPDELILCDPFQIPSFFRRIAGCDFGIDHPGACAWIAWNPDNDVLYLYDCYKEPGQTAAYHAAAIRARGEWIPVAWPHDGIQRDRGSGKPLMDQYRKAGVNMLPEPAAWDIEMQEKRGTGAARVGPQSREAGAVEILERMRTGRFKCFRGPSTEAFLREKSALHRKDGVIVPIEDDIESGVRYAVMMLRYAVSEAEGENPGPGELVEWNPLKDFGG